MQRLRAIGKPAGILTANHGRGRRYIGWGYLFVAVGVDVTLSRAAPTPWPNASSRDDTGRVSMGDIVFAAGIPHLPAMVGLYDRAPPDVQATVRNSFEALRTELRAATPDVIIIFANDHLVNSRIRSLPRLLIGMADEHRGPHEWFKPWIGCRDYAIKGDRHVAAAVFRGMIRRGIRMFAETGNLKFDDNISVPVTMGNLDTLGIPLVPVLQNCIVPPIPEQHRCYEVGQALGRHHPQRPAGRNAGGADRIGRAEPRPGGSRYYVIDEEFDRWFLELVDIRRSRANAEGIDVRPHGGVRFGRNGRTLGLGGDHGRDRRPPRPELRLCNAPRFPLRLRRGDLGPRQARGGKARKGAGMTQEPPQIL